MDIEKMSNIDISQDSVKSISDKCNHLKDLNKQIEQEEEKLSLLKHKARDMEERIIPEMMQEAGVSLLKLADGSTVEVKPFYAAKIPESRVDEAFSWLRNRGYEDLIKKPNKIIPELTDSYEITFYNTSSIPLHFRLLFF